MSLQTLIGVLFLGKIQHAKQSKLSKLIVFIRPGDREGWWADQAHQLGALGRLYGQECPHLLLNGTFTEDIDVYAASSDHTIIGAVSFLNGFLAATPPLHANSTDIDHYQPPVTDFAHREDWDGPLRALPPVSSPQRGQDVLTAVDCPLLKEAEKRIIKEALNSEREKEFKPLLDALEARTGPRQTLLQAHGTCKTLSVKHWTPGGVSPQLHRQCELLLAFVHFSLAADKNWRRTKQHVLIQKVRGFLRSTKSLLLLSLPASSLCAFLSIFFPQAHLAVLNAYLKEFNPAAAHHKDYLGVTALPFAASLAVQIHTSPARVDLVYNGETLRLPYSKFTTSRMRRELRRSRDRDFTQHCGNPAYPRTYPLKRVLKIIYLLTFCIVLGLSLYAFFFDLYKKRTEPEEQKAEPELITRE